jgi:hypothetical protein
MDEQFANDLWHCRHNWGRWVMVLNEVTPGLKEKAAPTDCRLRPDQHFMEVGEFDKVSSRQRRTDFGCFQISEHGP